MLPTGFGENTAVLLSAHVSSPARAVRVENRLKVYQQRDFLTNHRQTKVNYAAAGTGTSALCPLPSPPPPPPPSLSRRVEHTHTAAARDTDGLQIGGGARSKVHARLCVHDSTRQSLNRATVLSHRVRARLAPLSLSLSFCFLGGLWPLAIYHGAPNVQAGKRGVCPRVPVVYF